MCDGKKERGKGGWQAGRQRRGCDNEVNEIADFSSHHTRANCLRWMDSKRKKCDGRTCGNAIGILLADALGLGLALLEGVLVLELAAHFGGYFET